MSKALVAFVVASPLLTCATALADEPPSPKPDKGLIGITVDAKGPLPLVRWTGVEVFLVRVEEDQDPFRATTGPKSNYYSSGQVFLLNADPGTYVAVAAALQGANGVRAYAFLSEEAIAASQVTVEAGSIAFMGRLSLKNSFGAGNADATQMHYSSEILRPEIIGSAYPAGSLMSQLVDAVRDAETEKDFWTRAAERSFRRYRAWQEVIRQRRLPPAGVTALALDYCCVPPNRARAASMSASSLVGETATSTWTPAASFSPPRRWK